MRPTPGCTYFFTLVQASDDTNITQVMIHLSKDRHWSFSVYVNGRLEQASKRARFAEVLEILRASKQFESLSTDTEKLTQATKQLFGA